MSNSSLVNYRRISPNRSSPRNHAIDTITIHCVVGQCSAQTLGSMFAESSIQTSSNYGIGFDGKIGMYVEEKDRSWCSSNAANDNRAITIEVASDTTEPYAVNKKAYAALLNLVTDICKRNGIKQLLWKGDKSLVGQTDKQNMTVHRWFANKSCPGTYLYDKHPEIAAEVNRRLGATKDDSAPSKEFEQYQVKVDISDLSIRKGPGTNYPKTGRFTGKGVFTISAEAVGAGSKKGWGKLKSGAGWISLDYVSKHT